MDSGLRPRYHYLKEYVTFEKTTEVYITWTPRLRRRMGYDKRSATVTDGNSAVNSAWLAASLATNRHSRGKEFV